MDVSVIVLAFGAEPWLAEAVDSALASEGVAVEVVVVDNGAAEAVAGIAGRPGVRIVRPGANLGFAGGVNAGVAASAGDVVCLLNSDAHVAPDCVARLAAHVREHDGVAGALVLLDDEPGTINSAGNPLHVLGLSWAGGLGQPRSSAAPVAEVASASGACLALRRSLWDRLDGFDDAFFAYLEDLDLCWRTHQLGLPVVVLADAAAWHHYEYGRTGIKRYLLERNRLLFLLTVHEGRTLAALALPLVALEGAMFVLAAAQGWAGQKAAGWGWLATHVDHVMTRRRRVQAARLVPDADLAGLLTARFSAAQEEMPAAGRVLERLLSGYWGLVRPLLGRPTLNRGGADMPGRGQAE